VTPPLEKPMSVRISEINVKGLGPIDSVSMKPGLFNLIYGRNEKGKTFLVEFIIRSLFRNAKDWKLRSAKGQGRISVEGLNGKTEFFSPALPKKIEDFWDQDKSGLPPDFSRLLAVKGAEMELVREVGGVDRAVLKNFLSGADFMDRIEGRISKTIQSARVEGKVILGPKQGEIREKSQLEEQLQKIDALFVQLDRGYSGGRRAILSGLRDRTAADLVRMEAARRHQARKLADSIQSLEKEKKRVDEEALKSLRRKLHQYQSRSDEFERRTGQQAAAETRSEHYEWLRSARDEYRELVKQTAIRANPILLISAIVVAVISVTCIVLGRSIPAILFLGAAMVLFVIRMNQLHAAAEQALHAEELNGLRKEFQFRFGLALTGLSHLEERLQKNEADYNEARILRKQLAEERRDLETMRQGIQAGFSDLHSASVSEDSWNSTLLEMEDGMKELSRQIEEKRVQFARLGAEPSDTAGEDDEPEFDERIHQDLMKRLRDVDRELDENTRKLDSLKHLICQQTDDEITTAWPQLIQNLKNKRAQTLSLLQDLQALILGKIALMQVIESVRKTEDAKIEEGLQSREIVESIQAVTRRYNRLRMDGNSILISDPHQEFAVSDLSTGAQEQTLLALRIGFASRLMKQDRLFLILDDAFQYSDWERRRYMIDTVVGLAKAGWQILYFTMDDHIRDLFDERGKAFGKEYVKFELK
jgi:uncharacterized protein YhaN